MSSIRTTIASVSCIASILWAGCGDAEPEVAFPEDWALTYQEVRDCRRSADHDLNFIRVFASPSAIGPYEDRSSPFPVGAVLLKEEFAFEDCEDLVSYTVMRKEPAGTDPEFGDWTWQRVNPERQIITREPNRCIDCHNTCSFNDLACADP